MKGQNQNFEKVKMGKLFGKVLQRRLQELAEELFYDSQCGFHSGRGFMDLIFIYLLRLYSTSAEGL